MKKTTKLFHEKSVAELTQEETKRRAELAKLMIEVKTNPPKDSNIIAKKRKELAVLLTTKHAKKLAEAQK